MTTSYYEWSATAIRDAVRDGKVSAEAVVDSHLLRIDDTDSKLKAFVDVWGDYARQRAKDVDAKVAAGKPLGSLAGVPIGLKDVLCTTEGTTTCASQILQGFRSLFDGTPITRMLAQDAIFVGKLNMDEFAMGSSTENSSLHTTRNPWDLSRVPGGSSGGSAASVAAEQCPIALGSDTGGSIRQPAALCGCVGMKPTYGRVSRYGLVAFASSLDQIGPFTRNVPDMALIMNVICGRDPMDATSADIPVPDFTKALEAGVKGLRIGLPKEYYTDALGPEMREKVLAALEVLQAQGATVVDVSLPHTDYAVAVYYIICTAEASANLARFDGVRYGNRATDATDVKDMYHLTKTRGFGKEVQRRIMLGTYVLSSGYYDAYYLKAQKVRALIRHDFERAFEQCDAIVTPTTPTPAFKIGEKCNDPLDMYLSDIYTISVNLAGIPGVSIPCGLSKDKLPAGLQIMGKAFDEATVLRVAYAYERHRNDDMGKPPLA